MFELVLIPCPLASEATATICEQVRQELPTLTHFWVENVRSARRFISSMRLSIDISQLHFEVLDKKTSTSKVEQFFQALPKGVQKVGIISEAGCPAVADPGAVAVAWAHAKGFKVNALVGPSSVVLALMSSGFSGQQFTFHGYLPIDKTALRAKLTALEQQSAKNASSQIFIETPYRNDFLLSFLLENCSPHTYLHIATNLTASDGWNKTNTIAQWKKTPAVLGKNPTIFILYAGAQSH